MSGRTSHESVAPAILAALREGEELFGPWWYRDTRKRLAAPIRNLRGQYGLPVLGNGKANSPYRLEDRAAHPTLVAMTDDMRDAYYQTSHWRSVRRERLGTDRGRCVLCAREAEQVHHVVYHLFAERLRELMSVCCRCHEAIHGAGDIAFPIGVAAEKVGLLGGTVSWPDWVLPPKPPAFVQAEWFHGL